MALRTRLLLYLILLHLGLAGLAFLVVSNNPRWLLPVEALFALTLGLGGLLWRSFNTPLGLPPLRSEEPPNLDFTSQVRPIGIPQVDEVIGLYNGMVDRLRTQRLALEEQHFFLEKVLGATPAAILTLNHDRSVSFFNPAAERLLGIPADELLGRDLQDLDHPLAHALAELETHTPRIVTLQGRRRVKATRARFFDRGAPRSFFVIEELTEELRASEKAAYEQIIRLMSHEVNNSVAAVISLLESCEDLLGSLPIEDRNDLLRALTVAGDRMQHLNQFMRGFAEVVRLPAPDPRPCDLRILLEDILHLLRPELNRCRIHLELEVPELPEILLDKNQIEQVLVNILKNAIESIGEDGTITVQVQLRADAAHLSVKDTGEGISPEIQERLFTPFFSTRRHGRGLGLTLIQEILTQHGFDFSLEGQATGGSEFRIRFPLESRAREGRNRALLPGQMV